jgi:citrate synthase
MGHTAKIEIDDKVREFPILEGTAHGLSIDISTLCAATGCITLDNGYGNRAGETQ